MIIACHALYAQQIEGIGPFKIGKTTTAVFNSFKNSGYSYDESPDWMVMLRKKSTKSVILLKADTTGFIRNSQTKLTEGLAVYNVGTIKSKGPKANNLILSFYKDTLCSIISNYYQTDFTQFVKKRIGVPKDSVHTTNIICVNFKNLAISDTISTYNSKADLRIFEARGFYYDRQCNRKLKYFFEISNPAIMKMLSKSSNSFDLIFPYLFQ